MSVFSKWIILVLTACLPLQARAERPNVILIMADDFGYECVTANGGESYRTPNLDRLAAEGMRFEQCHVQPLCTPTRVQLMTGRYNVRNYLNFGTLPEQERTFGHVFKEAGYATGICGKWQLGQGRELPQHFGFDESFLWQHTRRPPRYANPGLEHNGRELDYSKGEYGPDLVNDFALDFISRHKQEPFFLYYPLMLTHDPFQPTPDSDDWDPKRTGEKGLQYSKHFAHMTAYMDKLVGKLVAKVDELGLRKNTLIVFLGDNGTSPKITSRFKGADYPGGKGSTTARGTHVPLIVNWPGQVVPGKTNEDLISSTDVLPTLCLAAGLAVPDKVDGVSFWPQLQGQAGTPREWLYGWYSPRQKADMTVREYAFDSRYKLYKTGRFYDLVADPDEKAPLDVTKAPADAIATKGRLQTVLDQFSQARPAELDREFENQTAGAKARRKKAAGNE